MQAGETKIDNLPFQEEKIEDNTFIRIFKSGIVNEFEEVIRQYNENYKVKAD